MARQLPARMWQCSKRAWRALCRKNCDNAHHALRENRPESLLASARPAPHERPPTGTRSCLSAGVMGSCSSKQVRPGPRLAPGRRQSRRRRSRRQSPPGGCGLGRSRSPLPPPRAMRQCGLDRACLGRAMLSGLLVCGPGGRSPGGLRLAACSFGDGAQLRHHSLGRRGRARDQKQHHLQQAGEPRHGPARSPLGL